MAAKSMNRSGYNVRLAAGTITAGATLGILIPPSIMLVVMGPIMEIPVTDLFAAAIIPGILLAVLYAGYTTIRCYLDPSLGPVVPVADREKDIKVVLYEFFMGLVPPSLLVFSALGSILLGLATPTEAAGCGALGSILLSLAYRKLTLEKLKDGLIKTLEITALIMLLVAASPFVVTYWQVMRRITKWMPYLVVIGLAGIFSIYMLAQDSAACLLQCGRRRLLRW